jgi:cytidyltransferase-like protein
MMEKAKKLGDRLVVIVNNDHQVKLKSRVPFLNQADRLKIVSAIRWVDGDRNAGNITETTICRRLGIKIVDKGMGKKIRSSSILIARATKKNKAK